MCMDAYDQIQRWVCRREWMFDIMTEGKLRVLPSGISVTITSLSLGHTMF